MMYPDDLFQTSQARPKTKMNLFLQSYFNFKKNKYWLFVK